MPCSLRAQEKHCISTMDLLLGFCFDWDGLSLMRSGRTDAFACRKMTPGSCTAGLRSALGLRSGEGRLPRDRYRCLAETQMSGHHRFAQDREGRGVHRGVRLQPMARRVVHGGRTPRWPSSLESSLVHPEELLGSGDSVGIRTRSPDHIGIDAGRVCGRLQHARRINPTHNHSIATD